MATEKDFGDIGEAQLNFHRMSQGMVRPKEIMEKAEDDDLIHLETWVKELAKVVHSMFMSTGAMRICAYQPPSRTAEQEDMEEVESTDTQKESWSTE